MVRSWLIYSDFGDEGDRMLEGGGVFNNGLSAGVFIKWATGVMKYFSSLSHTLSALTGVNTFKHVTTVISLLKLWKRSAFLVVNPVVKYVKPLFKWMFIPKYLDRTLQNQLLLKWYFSKFLYLVALKSKVLDACRAYPSLIDLNNDPGGDLNSVVWLGSIFGTPFSKYSGQTEIETLWH